VAAGRSRDIDALAIPPAWTDVHIAASPRAAIQAWGYDARGRKQYRYHQQAVQRGERRKYYRMRQMAHDLPAIRHRLAADFRTRGLSKARVLAGVVKLLSEGFFRVGNEQYARENHTFGITTLRKSHVRVDGDVIIFSFVGKRSIKHKRSVVSAELARFVSALLETPGPRLFRYALPDGGWSNIDARQVNDYIQSIAAFPYSAKDFRTWGGSLRAATVLAELGPPESEREAKRNVATMMRLVAAELGNTPAICRKSYVHPILVEQYLQHGAFIRWRSAPAGKPRNAWAHAPEERALIAFLDEHFPERRKRRRRE